LNFNGFFFFHLGNWPIGYLCLLLQHEQHGIIVCQIREQQGACVESSTR
jgi:hypothetical protein